MVAPRCLLVKGHWLTDSAVHLPRAGALLVRSLDHRASLLMLETAFLPQLGFVQGHTLHTQAPVRLSLNARARMRRAVANQHHLLPPDAQRRHWLCGS